MEQCGVGHSPGSALLMSGRAGRGFGGIGQSLFLVGTSSLFSTLLSSLTRAGTYLGMLPMPHTLTYTLKMEILGDTTFISLANEIDYLCIRQCSGVTGQIRCEMKRHVV